MPVCPVVQRQIILIFQHCLQSKYEPGKRHWLKIKKDYLEQGTMADSADLVVLGAYFGTGNKGTAHSLIILWTGVRVYR